MNIPYLYVVGDGVPNNLISMAGDGDDGAVGQQTAGGYVILQIIDRYGVPVPDLPVTFSVSSGGGQLIPLANATDNYGIVAAESFLGPNPGGNVYSATAGSLTASFTATGLARPTILPNGAVNAANYTNQPGAPGSYIALLGNNLATSASSYSTPYLPIALNHVNVSFNNPNVSVPGHIARRTIRRTRPARLRLTPTAPLFSSLLGNIVLGPNTVPKRYRPRPFGKCE